MLPRPIERRTRRHLRLITGDCSRGTFFLTLCSATRDPVFGWLTGGEFLPSPLGRFVRECWLSVPVHHPECRLDAFALMPDHLHALVHFHPGAGTGPAGTPRSAGARGGLGTVVGHFKRAVTIGARQDDLAAPEPLWQRGYFERIVRDDRMLTAVREYILHNALKESLRLKGRRVPPPVPVPS